MNNQEYQGCPKPTKREPKPKAAIKRTALKPKPYTLKKPKPIRKVSAKQAKVESEKSKVYRERSEGERPFCRGCGSFTSPLSNSHRIGQADKRHAANPQNLDTYCMDGKDCHNLFADGYLWRLDNGSEVLEWLAETDRERYATKVYKMIDRINDLNLSQDDLPDWVAIHILEVTG